MLARVAVFAVALAVPVAVRLRDDRGRTDVAPEPVPTPRESRITDPRPRPTPVGVAGCAAAACHGDPGGTSLTTAPGADAWRSAVPHWRAVDPHTRAFAALQTPLAATIVAKLGSKAGATADARCLACHTDPALAASDAGLTAPRAAGLRAEGVGCEACHGDAGGWQFAHTGWRTPVERAAGYDTFAMPKLYDVGERAVMCAGCHVGAPADPQRGYPVRDMNHDMIAAGHPRLNFDFAGYQRRLPPHWQEQDFATDRDVTRTPGVDSKAWLVGTAATAEAACRLLADRVDRAETGAAVWPEFAEGNCYACHHDLVPAGWRSTAVGYYKGRRPGTLPWQTHWPFDPLANAALPNWNGAAFADLLAAVQSPRPNPTAVRAAARRTADALAKTRAALSRETESAALDRLRGLLLGPALTDGEVDRLPWDAAGQAYTALTAFDRDRTRLARGTGNPRDPEAATALLGLYDALVLRRETGAAGPAGYSPAAVRARFKAVRDLIPTDVPPPNKVEN